MTASDIPEAQIDRMTQEIDRQAREIVRYRLGIINVKNYVLALAEEETVVEMLDHLLDPGPAARGETPLLEVE